MANNYQNMRIRKDIKQEIKLKALYIIDIGIIGGLCGGMFFLQSRLALPMVHFVVLEVLLLCLAIFLCAKPSSNGGRRNLYTVYCLLRMDRKTYAVQSYEYKE